MKNFLDKLRQIFYKNNTQKTEDPLIQPDSIMDVIVSLTKNYDIDVKLLFDDKTTNKPLSEIEYALVCAEFLNIIMSGKLQNQLLDIIINQIRNDNNSHLIDKILGFLVLIEKQNKDNEDKDSTPMIKPSQVFSKYKNG